MAEKASSEKEKEKELDLPMQGFAGTSGGGDGAAGEGDGKGGGALQGAGGLEDGGGDDGGAGEPAVGQKGYERLRFSVVRIQSVSGEFDWFHPYERPRDGQAVGSGFVVIAEDTVKDPTALIITN